MKNQKRAPRWIWLLLGCGILAWLGAIVLPLIHCHYSGKETVAVIANVTTRMEGGVGPEDSPRQVRYYSLAFDGHLIQKRSAGGREKGDRMPVIYLPDDPGSVVQGSRAEGLWNTIERSTNERNLAIATGLALFFCSVLPSKQLPRRHSKITFDAARTQITVCCHSPLFLEAAIVHTNNMRA